MDEFILWFIVGGIFGCGVIVGLVLPFILRAII